MATPEGAKHRDVEQRFRDLERKVRDLTSRALQRPALGVSEGDFTVEGGGAVVVRDGGGLQAYHDNDQVALYFGPYIVGSNLNQGLLISDPAGLPILSGEYDTVSGERRVRLGNQAGARLSSLRTAATETILYGPNDQSYIYMVPDGSIQLHPDVAAGKTVAIAHGTTPAGANCYIDANGNIYRSTSSRRYKQDVQPAEVDAEAVLALQPRAYRSRAEVDELGDDAPTHAGFIAEEAADLGLEQWVLRDDDGQPEAFNYAQFCVAQQAVIQQQAAAIADLTARLEALENAEGTTPDSRKGSTP